MATSYANNSGTGERRPEIIVTTDIQSAATDLGAGVLYSSEDIAVLIDGVTGANGREPGNANNGADRHITFDWNSGAEGGIVINEFKFYAQNTNSYGTWTFDGSDDGSSWTTLHTLTLSGNSGAAQVYSFSNSTGYRYYRLHTTNFQNGGGGNGFWREIEFKIEDVTPQASRPSWYNTNGFGNRTSAIATSTTLSLSAGTINNVVDGDYSNNSTGAIGINAGGSSKEIVFDFGAGATDTLIDTVAIWQENSSNTHGTWKLQGSADGSSWTDVGSTFPLTGSTYNLNIHQIGNITGYRYYRLLQTAGSTNSAPNILEIEFRIKQAGGGATSVYAYKVTQYTVLQSSRDVRARKTTMYTVLQPPPPVVAYKTTMYTVLEPIPSSVRAYKTTQYAVLAPPPPVVAYKTTMYSVIAPPPTASDLTELTTLTDVLTEPGTFSHYFLADFNAGGDPAPRFMVVLFGKKVGSSFITMCKYVVQDWSLFVSFDPLNVDPQLPTEMDIGAGLLGIGDGGVNPITVRDAVFDRRSKYIGLFVQNDITDKVYYALFNTFVDGVQRTSSADVIPLPNNKSFNARRGDASRDYRYISDDQLVTINEPLLDVVIDDRTLSGVGAPAYAGAQWYDGSRRAITYVDVNGDLTTIYTQKYAGAAATLDKIIRRVLNKVGITDDFIDVSGVTAIGIEGYLVRDQGSAMEVIEELCNFFHINMVETSGKLTFRSLVNADTINVEDNHWHTQVTVKAVDVSDEITSAEVTYYDLDQDDNSNVQTVTKSQFTDLVDYVANEEAITYKAAVFTTAARARRSAEVYIFKDTQRLDSRTIVLAPYHMAVEPGDMLGNNFRVHKLTVGAALDLGVEAETDSQDNYFLTDLPAAELLSFVDTTLKDYDHGTKNYPIGLAINPFDFGALNNNIYVGLVNPDDTEYVPTEIVLRGPGSYPIKFGKPPREMIYGRVVNPPLNGRTNMFTTDYESELIITFKKEIPAGVIASLDSLTPYYTSVKNNLLMVGKELIQYQIAEIDIDNKTVHFTGLGRGRFGTDEFASDHIVGEIAAVYDPNSMIAAEITAAISNLGVASFATYDTRATRLYNSEDIQVYRSMDRSWILGRLNIFKKTSDGVYFRAVARIPYGNGFMDDEDDIIQSYGQEPFAAILRAPFDLDTFMDNFDEIETGLRGNSLLASDYIARVFTCGVGTLGMQKETDVDSLLSHSLYNVSQMSADGITLDDDLHVAIFLLDLADSQALLKSAVRGFRFEGNGSIYYDSFQTGLDA